MRMRPDGTIRHAFTLVELMVVIALMGILATLVISVGSAVRGKAQENQVTGTLTVVQTAIGAYLDKRDSIPRPLVNWRDSNHRSILGNNNRMWAAKVNTGALLRAMRTVREAQTQMDGLSEEWFMTENIEYDPINDPGTMRDVTYFIDPYDNPIDYQRTSASGNSFVLISAGPNGIWGDADDLRSDD